MNRTGKTFLALGIIVATSGIVGFLMLNRGHDWGDDFAAYILQAQALVRGNIHELLRHSEFTIDHSPGTVGLTSYPWGLPLLLAPVYAAFGLDPLAFKLVLTASYMLFLVAYFLLARTRLTNAESLLLTAFMAFNASLLRAQNQIFADFPFLAWSTVSLWLIERYVNTESPPARSVTAGIAIGLSIFMAALTRFNGLLLLVPLALAQFQHRRSTSPLAGRPSGTLGLVAIPYAAFAVCYGLQALVLPSKLGGLQYAFDGFSGRLLLHHAAYYFVVTGRLLQESGLGFGSFALLFTFLVLRLSALRREDAPMLLYSVATLAYYVLYPPLQGPRFIYPILPVFFLLAFDGMRVAVRRLRPGSQNSVMLAICIVWAGMAAVALGVSVTDARSNLAAHREAPSGPFSPGAAAMFSFIRRSSPADSVVIFFKPRAMRLFTDRDSFLTWYCADLPQGDYVVIMQDEGIFNQVPPSSIRNCVSVSLANVFEQDNIVVYQISPPLPP